MGNLGQLGGGEELLVIPEITPLECYPFLGRVTENHLTKTQNQKNHANNSRKIVDLP